MCGAEQFMDQTLISEWYSSVWNGSPDLSLYQSIPMVNIYAMGQEISIEMAITAQHDGYFEFRLCADANYLSIIHGSTSDFAAKELALYKCLTENEDKALLRRKVPLPPGSSSNYIMTNPPVWTDLQLATRWRQTPQDGTASGDTFRSYPTYSLTYLLPAGVTCDRCVLQLY